MTAFKNLVSIIVAIIAVLVAVNAFTVVSQSSVHQIYTTCNYILATLLFIYSYMLADWTFADKSFIKETA